MLNNSVKDRDQTAVWSPACSFHCYYERGGGDVADRMQVPMGSGVTAGVALRMYMQGVKD